MVLDSMFSLHQNALCKRRPIPFEASSAFDSLTKRNPVSTETYELAATVMDEPAPKRYVDEPTPNYKDIAHTLSRRGAFRALRITDTAPGRLADCAGRCAGRTLKRS